MGQWQHVIDWFASAPTKVHEVWAIRELWEPKSHHRKEDIQERGFALACEQKFLWKHRLGRMRLPQVPLPPSPLTTHRGERGNSLALGGGGWDG